MNHEEKNPDFSIAVIGLSGRFPGAKSVEEFWDNLVKGKESISFFTDQELLESKVDPKMIDHPSYVRARGIIGEPESFDASFFGYSPREAETLDPQHRIFLECAWHAMEDAGYDPFKAPGKIGVLGGTGVPWYHLEMSKNPHLQAPSSGMAVIIGNEKDYLATRVSYKLHLTGTSVTVQCACSTSLTAIVLGMQTLLTYQNDMVLAGGVSISFPEKQGYLYEKGSLDSPDGHCRTFDERAQGTVFSSGAGVVVLKRLSDALRDKDNIYCVLRGGSINNDGTSKVSYTAPSVNGQIAVEIDALEMSSVHPESITYVEAHGTATQLGDPIEIKALTQSFRQYTSKKNYCAIGSVKTNIGHTDVASGVISLIKVALSLKNRMIPASLHFETPNPQIDFENSPFYVNTKTKKWEPLANAPLRALINSFGVGGANACVIAEEAPIVTSDSTNRSCFFLCLTGKTPTALSETTSNILKYVIEHPETNLSDLTYTLQVGRTLFEHRKLILFSNRDELIDRLSDKSLPSIVSADKNSDIVFMFPGQGNQYFGMGKDLYRSEPFFQKEVDNCCSILNKLSYEYDLIGMVFGQNEAISNREWVNQTIVAQPALFVIEYALAKYLLFLGIQPKAMIGHSIGEFVAACVAEVMGIEDALKIVVARAKITQSLPTGSMLAVFSGAEQVKEWVNYPNEIAVMNSPKLTVVAGPSDGISSLETELANKSISCKKLNTSHAFHSHMMDELIPPLQALISQVKLSPPKIPIMSTVSANWMTDKEAQDPIYWAQHARKPVNFCSAAQRILQENEEHNILYIETGPGYSLESAIKNCTHLTNIKTIGLVGSINNHMPGDKFFNLALGKISAFGGSIDFQKLYINENRKRLSLPGYPFERKKYLLDFKASVHKIEKEESEKIEDISDWFCLPSWKKSGPIKEMFELNTSDEQDLWIVFNNGDNFGSELIHYLRRTNQIVYSIQRGNDYKEEDPFHFFIDQTKVEDFIRFFENVKEKAKGSCRILHLWNFDHPTCQLPKIDQLNEYENTSFYGLIFLEQALIKVGLLDNLYLTFVASQVYNVLNDDIDVTKSLMIGPCRVFKNEYPQVQSRLVDLFMPITEKAQNKVIELLIAENLHRSDEIVVAYRNFSRWLPIYEPTPLPVASTKKRNFRENGVYLITGGLGGIGLNLARLIAQHVNARIILIQRSLLPDRAEWDSWLESRSEADNTSKKIRALKEIESLGSSVWIMKGDVSSYSEMENLIDQILILFPQINGVFHCAGSPSGGVISLKQREKAVEILRPKVQGTLILDELLKNQTLDFFISCSSVTGILGEPGQVDYCSANAFLDAFSHHKYSAGSPVFSSINWGAWDEIGMAVNAKIKPASYQDTYLKSELDVASRLRLLYVKDDRSVYQILLDPQRDWFIQNHRLKGIPTLVGTVFFEFLMQFSKEHSPNQSCTLSNIQFVAPLMFFSDFEKSLKLEVSEKDSSFKFTFFSQPKEANDETTGYQAHMYGEVSFNSFGNTESRDLNQLIGRLTEEPNLKKLEDDGTVLWRGAHWQSVTKVFTDGSEWLALLSLPAICRQIEDRFILHPALLDISTSFSVSYMVDELYLPFSYQRISVYLPLENEVVSHVHRKTLQDELISLDIDLLNSRGEILVRIEGYTLKKVAENTQKKSDTALSKNISQAEGIEAFKRYFFQWTCPQVIICSENFNNLLKENQPSLEESLKINDPVVKYPRPSLFTPYVEASNEIEKKVASIWESILGIDKLGIDDNFIELGGNSLMAIQVMAQLTDTFKINLSIESFLSNPTIRNVSDNVINQLIEMIDEEKVNELIGRD